VGDERKGTKIILKYMESGVGDGEEGDKDNIKVYGEQTSLNFVGNEFN